MITTIGVLGLGVTVDETFHMVFAKKRVGSVEHSTADPISEFVEPIRSWFDYKYEQRLGYRHETFKRGFQQTLKTSGPERIFVETGCVREKDDYGAGYSTYLIGELLSWYGGHLYTVDISKKNIELCRKITADFADAISYNTMDSVTFLTKWGQMAGGKSINFLYLDSYDYPGSPKDGPRDGPQEHCLAELNAALPHLDKKAVVLMDDSSLPGGGKPRLAKMKLAELGWHCILDDYQTLWTRA